MVTRAAAVEPEEEWTERQMKKRGRLTKIT